MSLSSGVLPGAGKQGPHLQSHRTNGTHFPIRMIPFRDLPFALVGPTVTENLLLSFSRDSAIGSLRPGESRVTASILQTRKRRPRVVM